MNSLFIQVASILHTFNITPALDEYGKPIHVEYTVTSNLLSYPIPFKCSIKPRSSSIETLINVPTQYEWIRVEAASSRYHGSCSFGYYRWQSVYERGPRLKENGQYYKLWIVFSIRVLIRCCTQDVHPVPDDAEVTELPGSIFVPVTVAVILFSWSAMETNGTSSYRQLSSHKETFIEEVR